MDNLINWGQDQRVFSCTWILPPHKYIYGFKRMTISYYCTLRRYSFTPQSCILMPAQWRMSWNPPSIAALLQNAWLRCIYSKKNLGTIIYSTKWGGAEGKTKSRHSDISTLYIFTRQVQVTGLRFKSLSSSGFISSGPLLALSAKSSNAQSRAPPFTARLLNNEFLCKRNIKIALGFPNLVNRREL